MTLRRMAWIILVYVVIGKLFLTGPSFAHDIAEAVQPNPFTGMPEIRSGVSVCLDGTRTPHNSALTVPTFYCGTGRAVTASDAIFIMETRNNAEMVQIKTELKSLSDKIGTLVQSTQETEKVLKEQVSTFNNQLRSSITARFDNLPAELMNSQAIKLLKEDLLNQMDKKLSEK